MNWVGRGRNHTGGKKNEVFLLLHIQGNYSAVLS